MPNYCTNNLTIEGDINELRSFIINEKGNFSFQCLVPLPEALQNSTSPATIVPDDTDKIAYVTAEHSCLKTQEEIVAKSKRILTVSESIDLKSEHGYDNRYDRQCANRGTKRDACEPNIDSDQTDSYMSIRFDTARSPPEHWFAALCEKFPHHIFTLEFEESGMGFEGTMHSNDDDGTYRVDWREYVPYCEYYGEKIEGTRWIESLDGDYSEDALKNYFICIDEDNDEYIEPTIEWAVTTIFSNKKPAKFYNIIFASQKDFGLVQRGSYLRIDKQTKSLRGCTQSGAINSDSISNPIIPLYGLSNYGSKPIDEYIKNNVFTFLAIAND